VSIRHRFVLALRECDPEASYAYEVYSSDKHAYFVFEKDRSAEMVGAMLRILFKRKPLIHNGKKP
jgi:hypothetical protein